MCPCPTGLALLWHVGCGEAQEFGHEVIDLVCEALPRGPVIGACDHVTLDPLQPRYRLLRYIPSCCTHLASKVSSSEAIPNLTLLPY
jgi:hypothetical protein